jgi:KaiC/GvpD/RAD55 family RecA-like ATPase
LNAVIQSKEIIIDKLTQEAQKEAERAENYSKQYESLYDKFLEIKRQTDYLKEAEQQKQLQEQQKQLKKQKKKICF